MYKSLQRHTKIKEQFNMTPAKAHDSPIQITKMSANKNQYASLKTA